MTLTAPSETNDFETLPEDPGSGALVDRVADGFVLLDDAVIELADADAVGDIARLISQRIDLTADRVVRAIDAPSEAALMVICRCAGLGVNGFSAILRMRRRHGPTSGTPSQVLVAFLNTPWETARRVVAMLKVHDVVEDPG